MRSLTHGSLGLAYKTIKANRGRSYATMLGIIMAVMSVIVVVSIGEGAKIQIRDQIGSLAENVISVRPGNSGGGLISKIEYEQSATLSNQDVRALSSVETIESITPLAPIDGAVRADDGKGTFSGSVVGTGAELAKILNRKVEFGAFFSEKQETERMAVIGSGVASKLFGEPVPLGRSLSFRGQEFVVIGVFQQINSVPLSVEMDFNSTVFIPYEVAQNFGRDTLPVREILVETKSVALVSQTANRINDKLLAVHGGQQSFSVLTRAEDNNSESEILDLITALVIGAAIISLILGGIGIMNVMLVSVTERMREIGVRKAVGATNRQILSQFVAEASVLSGLGFVVGALLSVIALVLINLFTPLKPVLPWEIIVICALSTLFIGIIFGSAPAIKAARKNPIDALRGN